MAVLPRHAHIPDIPGDTNISFEAMLYIFGVIVMCLQYINLYKTVWWLPHSHANYALVGLILFYYARYRNIGGHIVLPLSVCPSVCLHKFKVKT